MRIPKYLFYVYAFPTMAMTISSLINLLPFLQAPKLRIVNLTLSIFSMLVLAYIIYLVLCFLSAHKRDLETLLAKVKDAAKRGSLSFEIALVTEGLSERLSRLPSRIKPSILMLLIVIPHVTGIALTEVGIYMFRDVRPEAILMKGIMSFILPIIIFLTGGIITLVGVVFSIYGLHIANVDLYELEMLEDELLAAFRAIPKVSERLATRSYKVPKRNTLLYLILTIVTFSIFMIYWVYVVSFKDLEAHTKEDQRIFRSLKDILSAIGLS